jgi:HEAT repeat protein
MRFLFLAVLLRGALMADTPSIWLEKLNAASYLEDPQLALELASQAYEEMPDSLEVKKGALLLLAHAGQDQPMMKLYRELPQEAMTEEDKGRALEMMAWGVIKKGAKSESPPIRAVALLAAAFGNDAKGIKILKEHLVDPNHIIRLVAVQLSAKFRDNSLQEAIYQRLQHEKDPEIRVALVEAAGSMQIRKAKPILISILEFPGSSPEETAAAVEALLALSKEMEGSEIERLVSHPRACIRELAAALIGFQGQKSDAYLLLKLINDSHPAVRRRALEAVGSLRVSSLGDTKVIEAVVPLANDQNHEVALTASWVLMLENGERGHDYFKKAWDRADYSEKLYAAALLAGSGRYAFPLARILFQEEKDPFLQLNLALCMLHAEVSQESAMETLHKLVTGHEARWMKKKWGRFEARAPSDLCHRADIPRFPEVVNQIERLEVLNELAQRSYPKAQQAISSFLKERLFGVTGAAAFLLLSEGDDSALALIKFSLKDPSERTRLQAALALGILGSDPEALDTLKELYPGSSREQKEHIIEAFGKIADRSALPFLIDRLEESQQVLRLIAAAGIIQTLHE